jgi:hypothetical protein
VGGIGLCGWFFVDVIDTPDEPIIPRVHIVKVTPPSGAADARVFEIEAPPVDSDGEPIERKDEPDADKDDDDGIVDAAFLY